MKQSTAIGPTLSKSTEHLPSSTGQTDAIRTRFESIPRQQELATELVCFRDRGELTSIRYFANAYSVHVFRWLNVLAHTKCTIAVDSAHPVVAFSNDYLSARPVLPGWLKVPMTLRYLLSGLALRFSRSLSTSGIIHAHSASGYGFVAWLSGQPYVLGTYGSEIYGADQRGFVYRWLLRQILQGALRISVGSDESTKLLCERYAIPRERIYFFDLGYDDQNFYPIDAFQRAQMRRERRLPVDEPVWVVNRRTDPHYRTESVVKGFLAHCQQGGKGRLILLCGDHQADYTHSICEMILADKFGDRVVVVKQMLTPKEVGQWLQLGDYSFSVPRTDNFSISTLESLGCGTAPILANLEGYRPLRPCQAVQWMTEFESNDFCKVFAELGTKWSPLDEDQRQVCYQFAQDGYSTENAIRSIAAFYSGRPLRKQAWESRAA